MSNEHVSDSRRRWPEKAAVGVLAAAAFALLFLRTDALTADHPDFARPADHYKYIHMAESPTFGFHVAPYGWRVGVPLLARVLPFDTPIAFRLITVACLWATGVAVYYLVRATGLPSPLAFTGMLLYAAMGWPTKYLLFDFWLPDAAAFLLVVLVIYCVLTKKDAWFVVLLVLGAFVKESVLFAAPLYLTFRECPGSRRWFVLRWLGLTAPALLILVGLRVGIPAWNDDPAYLQTLPAELRSVDADAAKYSYGERLCEIGIWRVQQFSPEMLLAYTAGSFGVPAVVMPLLALRRNRPLLLRFAPFLLLVYAQLLFATDTQRLLILGFPVLILLALNGFDHFLRVWRAGPVVMLLVPLVILAFGLIDPTRFATSCVLQAGILSAFLLVGLLRQAWGARRRR